MRRQRGAIDFELTAIWLLIVLFLVFFWLSVVSIAAAEPVKFNFANDYFAPSGKDRWLTNMMSLEVGKWGIGSEMYTPRDKRRKELPDGDRPWDGYSYLQRTDKWEVGQGEYHVLKSRLGTLGEWSGAKEMQTWMHDDLGFGAHPEWVGQNPAQPAFDVIYSRLNRHYLQSVVGNSRLTQEYGVRLGNVNNSLFLDQELRKHFHKHFYIFAAIRGEAVAFNTHLDGRMFENDVYTVDKQWFVASGRLGVEVRFDDFFVSYTYRYLTEEFKGQDGRHLYGDVGIGFEF